MIRRAPLTSRLAEVGKEFHIGQTTAADGARFYSPGDLVRTAPRHFAAVALRIRREPRNDPRALLSFISI